MNEKDIVEPCNIRQVRQAWERYDALTCEDCISCIKTPAPSWRCEKEHKIEDLVICGEFDQERKTDDEERARKILTAEKIRHLQHELHEAARQCQEAIDSYEGASAKCRLIEKQLRDLGVDF